MFSLDMKGRLNLYSNRDHNPQDFACDVMRKYLNSES